MKYFTLSDLDLFSEWHSEKKIAWIIFIAIKSLIKNSVLGFVNQDFNSSILG